MADQQHVALLRQGVEAWNRWRREEPEARPDLSQANLMGMHLYEADLTHTNLFWADLAGANLHRADLTGAVLFGANLCGANLHQANLCEADLSDTGAPVAIPPAARSLSA